MLIRNWRTRGEPRFYHPAQMAIIAVGDFDEELVQQQIKVGPFPV